MNTKILVSPMMRLLITATVMVATLMQVLDTTIVNVALPHMQGSLAATADEITWVLTSYLVASAIFMPLTGYFTDLLGIKKYLLISIGGFVVASALCGAAVNITEIVVFRLLQGVFGAALVPLSQAILVNIFSENERGTAMAIWGVGVMVGPVLGPTLGGYLTDIASWRWNFYINVPIGILCMLLSWQVLPETTKKARSMDWWGLFLISLAIGATQFLLDRGNQDNWFDSNIICAAAFLAVISFLGFLLHNTGRKKDQSIVFDLGIFYDRNFAISSFLLGIFGLGLYGAMVTLPLMLEGIFNYPVLTTGLVMAPRGISGMISMLLVGQLIKKYDPRWLILIGIVVCASGMYISTLYSLEISPSWVIWAIILQGFGLGMVFVPLSALAFSTLPPPTHPEAAGLFSLTRTIGSSIGISIVATLLSRHTQTAWNQLGGFINPYNSAVQSFLQPLYLQPTTPKGAAVLGATISTHAQMQAYINIYAFITWSFLLMIPFVLLFKKSKQKEQVSAVME